MMNTWLLEYLPDFVTGMCVLSLLLFAFDKISAVFKKHRIPECVLLGSAFLMGAFGALSGMVIFNHKTRKPAFYIGVPLILAAQIVTLYLIFS